MPALSRKTPSDVDRRLLVVATAAVVVILILGGILAAAAFYLLIYKPLEASTTIHPTSSFSTTTTTAPSTIKATTSTITTTFACPPYIPPSPDYCRDGELVTSIDEDGCLSQPKCVVRATQPTTTRVEETTLPDAGSLSSSTTLPDYPALAACFNRRGVKLFVNNVCLESRCKGIQDIFGPAFYELNAINCDIEVNEGECDNARDNVESFGFPTWYIGTRDEYYPGATVTKIKTETGC